MGLLRWAGSNADRVGAQAQRKLVSQYPKEPVHSGHGQLRPWMIGISAARSKARAWGFKALKIKSSCF